MNIIVAAAQYPITNHATFEAWQAHISRWVREAADQQAELILFPEYGSMELVSFFPEAIQADLRRQVQEIDQLKDAFCATFVELAALHQVVIVAPSLPVIEADKRVNRVYVFSPKGIVGYQDKFFMTRFEDEEWGIETAPKQLTLFDTDWGSFGIQICYDVEFAIGSHWLADAGASLILAPSCTETIRGATRVHIGARARALENQVYTLVSQTIGEAPWSPAVDLNYGYAAVYSSPDKNLPEEGIIQTMTPQQPGWLVQSLDLSLLEAVRSGGQVFNYQDHQRLHAGFIDEAITVVRRHV